MSTSPGPAPRWVLPALGVLAGTAVQLQQAALLPALAMAGVAGLALGVAGWGWKRRECWSGTWLLTLAAAVLALAAANGRAAWRLAENLAPPLEGQDLQVTGVVSQLPRSTLSGTRFVLEVEEARLGAQPVTVPPRLSLGWYRGIDEDALLGGPAEELRAGQRWQLPVRLRRPHGPVNPGGFDLELWLFEQGIGASGYVRSRPGAAAVWLDARAGHPLQRARQDIRDAIARRVADPAVAGVLAALTVGDQQAIERADWDVFRNTGVAHLMAISGLHITMFAWMAAAVFGRLWRLCPRCLLQLPAPLAARWGGVLAALAYALLAGWGVPAQRTVGMLALVALLRSSGLRWPLPAVLLAVAAAMALADPWALLQPGFWLSFGAVALLAVSEPVFHRPASPPPAPWWPRLWRAIAGGLRTQWVATIGLTPLSMVFFHQVSVVGLLANLLAIPLVTLLITPLALLGVLLPPLWPIAATLVEVLRWALGAMAAWPWAVWHGATAPAWAVACGLLAGTLAVLNLPWWQRVLALPLVLALLVPPVPRPAQGEFEVVAADIGQGTAVLVRTARHLLVYDAGPAYSAESDAGVRVLLPLLRARGERQVDLLMLSHRDADHVGGAAALLAGLPVRQLSTSLADDHPLLAGHAPHRRCNAGRAWTWDGVQFEVLHPLAGDHALPLKPNALSCVLRVQGLAGGRPLRLLLTGDIEAAQEAALLARAGAALQADVLLVPHHGSRTSSSAAFIEAVQPGVALVQAGYRSRYGHPAPDVIERYRRLGVPVQRSDACGAWHLPPQGPAECERRRARRYWHHPGLAAAP
ncbi:MAG: DNA internalization-related competence protein ComEC/Rec2 [Rubrivivax sp.]|nr:DNA internalization-related competence protein ComEC/Rec2 [Rubrivivax sp.]